MSQIVPASFQALTPSQETACTPGRINGVYLTLHPDVTEELTEKMTGWFADRPEVCIVDSGTSDKQGMGFVLIEWMECEIDPLFLAIVRDEPLVGDYTVYARFMEE